MSEALEQAVEAGAKAFHDAMREKRFLRWETSSEEYRAEIRALVRPAVAAGRLAGLREAASLAAELDPNAVDVSAAILALAGEEG